MISRCHPSETKSPLCAHGMEMNRPFTVHNYKCYKEIELIKKCQFASEGAAVNELPLDVEASEDVFAFRIIQKWLEELDNAVWWDCGAEWSHSARVQPVKEKYDKSQIIHVSSIIRCTKWAACLLGVFCPERRHADHIKGSEENAYLCFFVWYSCKIKVHLEGGEHVTKCPRTWICSGFFPSHHSWCEKDMEVEHRPCFSQTDATKSYTPPLSWAVKIFFFFLLGPFGYKSGIALNTHLRVFPFLLLLSLFLAAYPRPLARCSFMCEAPHKADQAETLGPFLHTIRSVLPPLQPPPSLFSPPLCPSPKEKGDGILWR